MVSSNSETNIAVTYDDTNGKLNFSSTDTNTQLTNEQVQDIVGGMVSGNTENNIAVTYDDTNGKLNFDSTDTNTVYTNSDVDAHLNRNSSTSAGLVLAWNGSDYSWTTRSNYQNSDVDTHLNQSSASTNEVLSWNGSDYAWVAQSGGGSGVTYSNHVYNCLLYTSPSPRD